MKIIEGMGREYYAQTATPQNLQGPVSKSLLWDFNRSPYKWFHNRREKESTPAMRTGVLYHTACLEPHKLETEYIVSPYSDFRTKEAREWRDSMTGIQVITADEYIKAESAGYAFRKNPAIEHLPGYRTELAVFADVFGTPCKCLVDLVPDSGVSLIDLKTTQSIESVEQLTSLIINRGYHWQAALYLDLWNMASGDNRTEFMFVFMEVDRPYEMANILLDEDFIKLGREGYMQALAKWNQCVQTSNFPPAIDGIQTISPPKWAIKTK